jgi:hypothetical protein
MAGSSIIEAWDPVTRTYQSVNIGVPARTPLHATLTVTGARAQLTTATGDTGHSHDGWTLVLPGGGASIRLGTVTVTASTQRRLVAHATDPTEHVVPSGALDGWYVISEGADVAIELTGAVDT